MNSIPIIKFKKIDDKVILPTKATPFDAGFDLTPVRYEIKDNAIVYYFGFITEIPEGYAVLLFPRSSIVKTDLSLSNCVGVIDCKYRNEWMVKFNLALKPAMMIKSYCPLPKDLQEISTCFNIYKLDKPIVQAIMVKLCGETWEEVDEINMEGDRGGGYGHTDNIDKN